MHIRHTSKGWYYRFSDGEESGPYESVYAVTNAADIAFVHRITEREEWETQQARAPKGFPPFPGARRRLHGVVLEWIDTRESLDGEERRFAMQSHGVAGNMLLHCDVDGAWSYRLDEPNASESPGSWSTAEEALSAAARAYFSVAKRRAKERSGADIV